MNRKRTDEVCANPIAAAAIAPENPAMKYVTQRKTDRVANARAGTRTPRLRAGVECPAPIPERAAHAADHRSSERYYPYGDAAMPAT